MTTVRNVDQRVLGAGTTVRFGLLLVLLVAASASGMSFFIINFADPHNNTLGCFLASGWNPNSNWLANSLFPVTADMSGVRACLQHYAPTAPWWAPLLGVGLLLGVAAALFWGIPAWKGRGSQVADVQDVDLRGDLAPALEDLVRVTGLDANQVTFVINAGRVTTSAVVFGRHTVCLDGGLVARRQSDPAGFRAVVLHELAHIRNRDAPITYATVALWRTFLIAVLIPQSVLLGWELYEDAKSVAGAGDRPGAVHQLLLLAFLTVLVYLTRADILRNREVYADLDARDWGADPRHWPDTTPDSRNIFASFREVWHTHPGWDRRRQSLTDPVQLFGIQPLPVFLTGAASIILGAEVPTLLSVLFPGGRWLNTLTPWLTALPITVIIGVALWRAVAHAVLTGRRSPSGVRTGLWLGAGLVVGDLVLDRSTGDQWFPSQPEVLILHFFVAALITWWTTECAELFIRTWRGRSLRPAMLLGLVVPWLAFSFWFGWWQSTGYYFSTGFIYNGKLALEKIFPGAPTSHSGVTAMISPVMGVLGSFSLHPLITWVMTAMWLVPLLVWTVRPAAETPHWARKALSAEADDPPQTSEQVPSLRKPLVVALLGGALGAIATAAIMAYQHSWQPAMDQRSGFYFLSYLSLLFLALAIAPVTAAAATAFIMPRYRLLFVLVAAGVAALVDFAVAFVLTSADGCLGPLNTMESRCHWDPQALWPLFVRFLMPAVLGPCVFAGASMALLVATALRLFKRTSPDNEKSPPSPSARWALKRTGIAAICVGALGVTAAGIVLPGAKGPSDFTPQEIAPALAKTPVTAEVRRAQVQAWLHYGGGDLIHRIILTDMVDLDSALEANTYSIPLAKVAPLCADMYRATQSATSYFPIPDITLQSEWSTVIGKLSTASVDCMESLVQKNADMFITAFQEMTNVLDASSPLLLNMSTQVGP